MGPNRRHNDESIQMDSSHHATGPEQKDSQATRLESKFNERQGELKTHQRSRGRLKYMQV